MWWSVLSRAIADVVKDGDRFALIWIDSDLFRVGSYLWICQALSIRPCIVRQRIRDGYTFDQVKRYSNKTWAKTVIGKYGE